MKTLTIAAKDLKHIFQSGFSLVMMFGAPLLITGLLAFAFGGRTSGTDTFNLPVTRVQVVNLDQPAGADPGFAAGKLLVAVLQDPSLSDLLAVTLAADEASARTAVDEQRAGVAIIIPPDFTAAATSPDRGAAVVIYRDPTLTIGPGIVTDLVRHVIDGFSGAKIAGQVTAEGLSAAGAEADQALKDNIIRAYTAWLQSDEHGAEGAAVPRLAVVAPTGAAQPKSQGAAPIGPIMAGMLVFFVFFMGGNGAESIIREAEQGTLARLSSTPTPLAAMLGGKFIGVMVSLGLQVAVLLLASILLFGIQWGQAATVMLVSLGLIVASAGFGVMLMSLITSSRQTGPVLGGVMTLTGMLGGLFTTTIPNIPAGFDRVALLTPQGWALQGWKLALSGAGVGETLVPVVVMLVMGSAFLAVGVALFRRRFA
ncbi:MAG: ABC transporter permease [Chloroflexi bacterium]|nr:ABC transporter permease [Chloroflexota bacterium]